MLEEVDAPDYSPNHPDDYMTLSAAKQVALARWITAHIFRARKTNYDDTSFQLRLRFANDPNGFFITNGQIKGAMLAAGHLPVEPDAWNWIFKIDVRV